ncbi:MAG: hypothetical protein U9Q77_04710 [Candidatus Marinimicrobia bacterium]|nr:hypothetical protein [Candidatus Neomarinimicrobiota bacterium]
MAKTFKVFITCMLAIIIISCAAKSPQVESLSFPADMNQPFLTFEYFLGEGPTSQDGFLKRLWGKITGPTASLFLVRPSAVTAGEAGEIFVVDADAARVLRYQFSDAGELKSVVTFGERLFVSPQGIALINGVIYVSDAETGLIHQFDLKLNNLGTLEIEGLQRPGRLKANPHTDELYIIDTPGHQILITDTNGQLKTRLNNTRLGRQILKAPLDVDFTSEGNLVILDGLTRRVEFLSPDYKYLSGFGGYDRVPGSFSYPRGLAISSDGYVFVSDAAFGNVQIFDPSGALLYFWGEHGSQPGEFLLPAALTFDAQDNLYIVDQYNNRVQVFHYLAQGR